MPLINLRGRDYPLSATPEAKANPSTNKARGLGLLGGAARRNPNVRNAIKGAGMGLVGTAISMLRKKK